MVKLELAHSEVVLLILDYLRENGLLASMLQLEQESNLSLFKYSQDISFLRQLILEGNWPQVEQLLKAVSRKGKFDLNRGIFHVKRQQYLEILSGPQIEKENLQSVVSELQQFCEEEMFHQLCMLLSLPKLTDHQQYRDWTCQKGRLDTFQQIRQLFSFIYQSGSDATIEKRRAPPGRLTKLLKDTVLFQYLQAKQQGCKPQFKFDPITQSQEASLLRDLISTENQIRFQSQNLAELKVSFKQPQRNFSTHNPSPLQPTPKKQDLFDQTGIELDQSGDNSDDCFDTFDKGEPITTTVHMQRRREGSEDNIYHSQQLSSTANQLRVSGAEFDENDSNFDQEVSYVMQHHSQEDTLVQSMPDAHQSTAPLLQQPSKQQIQKLQSQVFSQQQFKLNPQNQLIGVASQKKRQEVIGMYNSNSNDKQQVQQQYQASRKPQYHHQRKNSNNAPSMQQQKQHHQSLDEESEEPLVQMVSDIEVPQSDSTMQSMTQCAILRDSQPIRACCFSPSGNYFVLGTNSKALKICQLPDFAAEDESPDPEQQIRVVLEQYNHHAGSIYCVDWSRTERLIASGSNDRQIKLLVVPNLEYNSDQVLEMTLQGHQAIVRTVCFNPSNDLVLLSGGQIDRDVKVWNSETGKQIASLKGHQGDIHSIKMAQDGSFALSVGTDKKILIFDIRVQNAVGSMDASSMSEMHEVALSSQSNLDHSQQNISSVGGAPNSWQNPKMDMNGFAAVGHLDGSLSIWNINMRQCFAQQNLHSQQIRGISYSVDGNFIASAGYDGDLHISDTVNLDKVKIVKTLKHDDKVVSVKWHPYLPLLLSSGADKTARLWFPSVNRDSLF